MSRNVSDVFSDAAQREKQGKIVSESFDFQKFWCILKLVELYFEGVDFGIALEVGDDVAIVDSIDDVRSVKFYQIKTSNVDKPVGFLTDAEGRDGSVAAKSMYMFYNENFNSGLIEEIILVCNFKFNFCKKLYRDNFVSVCEFDKIHRDRVFTSIKEKYDCARIEDMWIYGVEYIEAGRGNIDSMAYASLGKLVDSELGSVKFNLTAFYATVVDFVGKSKNGKGADKFVTRSDVHKWLDGLKDESKEGEVLVYVERYIESLDIVESEGGRLLSGVKAYHVEIRGGDALACAVREKVIDVYHRIGERMRFDYDFVCAAYFAIVDDVSEWRMHEFMIKGAMIYERHKMRKIR